LEPRGAWRRGRGLGMGAELAVGEKGWTGWVLCLGWVLVREIWGGVPL